MTSLATRRTQATHTARPLCSSCGSSARLWPCKTAPAVRVCARCQGWVASLHRAAAKAAIATEATL